MNNQNIEPSLARKCAQLKQKIRLSNCTHKTIRIIFTESGEWIEYCIDCSSVVSVNGHNTVKTQDIHCIHNEDDCVFYLIDGGGYVEICQSCFQLLTCYER